MRTVSVSMVSLEDGAFDGADRKALLGVGEREGVEGGVGIEDSTGEEAIVQRGGELKNTARYT